MTEEIIRKLTAELNKGIDTEVQVVYVLAGIRKLIERDTLEGKYPGLKFHCDWALHSMMDRAGAKAILRKFDAAHSLLKGRVALNDLPTILRNEIDRISQMKSFSEELSQFLEVYNLPPLTQNRSDGWAHFLHLYTRVVEDIPLVVTSPVETKKQKKQAATDNSPKHIAKVTVHCESAKETVKHSGGEEMLFKVRWRVCDKNGETGEVFIINSFSRTP